MPAIAAQPWRHCRSLVLTLLAMLVGFSAARPADAQMTQSSKPIFAVPPSIWDRRMVSARPLLTQTISDFAALADGIVFGMGPGEVNAHMPVPAKGVTWTALPQATEFQDDVRYFWVKFDDAPNLHTGATACAGDESYIVFMFKTRGLFRISYRLMPSAVCPRTAEVLGQIFGRFVSMTTDIAYSVHYRAGPLDVLDITDATAGYMLSTRWQPRVE
jgi:hypothetical protein